MCMSDVQQVKSVSGWTCLRRCEQAQFLSGSRLALPRQSALQLAGRGAAPRTIAMATRKVNTLDDSWKKVRRPPRCSSPQGDLLLSGG